MGEQDAEALCRDVDGGQPIVHLGAALGTSLQEMHAKLHTASSCIEHLIANAAHTSTSLDNARELVEETPGDLDVDFALLDKTQHHAAIKKVHSDITGFLARSIDTESMNKLPMSLRRSALKEISSATSCFEGGVSSGQSTPTAASSGDLESPRMGDRDDAVATWTSAPDLSPLSTLS